MNIRTEKTNIFDHLRLKHQKNIPNIALKPILNHVFYVV